MNVLVMCAKAPVSVDIARSLIASGHRVWTADSFKHPVGKYCKGIEGFIETPSPVDNFKRFNEEVVKVCTSLKIDAIIPTSEIAFWLAQLTGLPAHTTVRTMPIATLNKLHDKYEFSKLADNLGYGAGINLELSSKEQLLDVLESITDLHNYVVKPVYSRFASNALISPSLEHLNALEPTETSPWILQRRIRGTEYCVYALAEKGVVLAYSEYLPKYRLSAHGASVYFEPIYNRRLQSLVMDFAEATKCTGQISFDVIHSEDEDRYVAIECNPRATSGAHLMAQHPRVFSNALLGIGEKSKPLTFSPMMLALPLIMHNPAILVKDWTSIARATDAMSQAGISLGTQARSMLEVIKIAIKNKTTLLKASTEDIEWNG